MISRASALAATLAAFLSPLFAATPMSHEETVVRTAYARLSFAARMGVLLHYAEDARVGREATKSELESQLDSQLAFHLDSFHVGNLSDIADTRWDALVSKPQFDLISVAFGCGKVPTKVGQSNPFTEMSWLDPSWNRWQEYDADWSFPVRQVVADLPKDTGKPETRYSRYAAFSVTASLSGRQRTYQAIFLFGRSPDGSEAVYFIDHILGMGVFDTAAQRSFYPQPLLETDMRELPEIASWISSAGVAYTGGASDVACDAPTGRCGLPQKLLEKSLSLPVDPDTRKFYQPFRLPGAAKVPAGSWGVNPTQDNAPGNATSCSGYNASFPSTQVSDGTGDHSSGGHSISQGFNATCSYLSGNSSNCNSTCQVSPVSGQSTQSDTGKTVTGYCHVVNLNSSSGDGSATNGRPHAPVPYMGERINAPLPPVTVQLQSALLVS